MPVSFLVFDVLHLDGTSLLGETYDERRVVLEALDLAGDRWAVPPAFDGQAADALEASRAQGLEGVLAKRHDSTYLPGRRSPHWVKVKHQRMQEVVVGGWSPGAGRREGGIGSLLLGVPDDDGRLVYAGHVGTGFTDSVLADLGSRLRARSGGRRRSPTRCRGPTPRTRTGSRPGWWARCGSRSGPATAGCGTRPGAACVPTRTPRTYAGRADR